MRQTDQRLQSCLTITVHDNIYMYSSPSDISLVDSARDKSREWSGWEHFNKSLDAREMLQLAINLGIPLNFKRGSKEDLSQELWSEMCMRADDRRQAKSPVHRDPLTGKKRGRKKRDLSGRRYIVQEKIEDKKLTLNDAPMTTRQAKKIYEFFIDEVLRTGSQVVTEGRMKDIVNDRAEELNTKQDPWRIFCYYRPELIDCQLVKLEK